MHTCSVVDTAESQPSPLPPLHVPSSDRHTCSTGPRALLMAGREGHYMQAAADHSMTGMQTCVQASQCRSFIC